MGSSDCLKYTWVYYLYQQSSTMKKLKQVMLSDISKKNPGDKNQSFSKPYGIWKSKPTSKRLKQNLEKEVKHLDDSKLKSSRSPLKSAKSNIPKKNKRSKSLVYDKKPHIKIQTTHNSSELAEQFKFIKKEQKELLQLDFFSANGQDKLQQKSSSVLGTHPFCRKEKVDCSTQYKQILIVDTEIQCDEFRHQDDRKNNALLSEFQRQKSEYRLNLCTLQQKLEIIASQARKKEHETRSAHLEEVEELRLSIDKLKQINLTMSRESQNLKEIIKIKQNRIEQVLATQKQLEQCLQAETAEKEKAIGLNQELKKEVSFYRQELASFETNLSDFQKMKTVYEKRLDCLERQKVKIKNHARELLEMVEQYKKNEIPRE